ncbi:hypothetical protein DFP72DRAFT_895760 [Ephemerocybe angulata]|uniref:Uncharacterized protein n=1 Tax=Ephemerocybe angulata TaxID=980116 RepID=A0A8H6I220_9AGAR|nr:hypothetical protein DFP72DRAFT_895760 [Tulosesus angulatus]
MEPLNIPLISEWTDDLDKMFDIGLCAYGDTAGVKDMLSEEASSVRGLFISGYIRRRLSINMPASVVEDKVKENVRLRPTADIELKRRLAIQSRTHTTLSHSISLKPGTASTAGPIVLPDVTYARFPDECDLKVASTVATGKKDLYLTFCSYWGLTPTAQVCFLPGGLRKGKTMTVSLTPKEHQHRGGTQEYSITIGQEHLHDCLMVPSSRLYVTLYLEEDAYAALSFLNTSMGYRDGTPRAFDLSFKTEHLRPAFQREQSRRGTYASSSPYSGGVLEATRRAKGTQVTLPGIDRLISNDRMPEVYSGHNQYQEDTARLFLETPASDTTSTSQSEDVGAYPQISSRSSPSQHNVRTIESQSLACILAKHADSYPIRSPSVPHSAQTGRHFPCRPVLGPEFADYNSTPTSSSEVQAGSTTRGTTSPSEGRENPYVCDPYIRRAHV